MNFFDLHADTPLILAEHPGQSPAVHLTGHGFTAYTQVLAIWLRDTCLNPAQTYRERLDLLQCYLQKQGIRLAGQKESVENRVILSVENAGFLADQPDLLFKLWEDGVRMLSFSWNGDNRLTGGAGGNQGLTLAGREIIRHMNQLGLPLDVSHLSRKATLQAIEAADFVLASHSCCDAVFSHPRNLTDEALLLLREKGGIVGLCFYPDFLGSGSVFQNLKDQILHLLSLGMEEHIAIGSDFDGADMAPALKTTADVPALYRFLADGGMEKALLDRIFYQNALAFFQKICEN